MTNLLGRRARAVLQTSSRTGEPSCLFKKCSRSPVSLSRFTHSPQAAHVFLSPSLHHLLLTRPFSSVANERPRIYLHLPGLIRTQTQLLRLVGRWISRGSLASGPFAMCSHDRVLWNGQMSDSFASLDSDFSSVHLPAYGWSSNGHGHFWELSNGNLSWGHI